MDKEKAIIDQLHREVALLQQQKKSDEEIIQALVSRGTERHYAEIVLFNVKRGRLYKKGVRINLFIGLSLLVLGILLTYISGRIAQKTGSAYNVIFIGILVAGVSFTARAVILYRK